MARRVPTRDVVVLVMLCGTWWVVLLALPFDGAWGLVRLAGCLVIGVLAVLMALRMRRRAAVQATTGRGPDDPGAHHGGARRPQSVTTGTVPHH